MAERYVSNQKYGRLSFEFCSSSFYPYTIRNNKGNQDVLLRDDCESMKL